MSSDRELVHFEPGERVMVEGEIATAVFLLWKGRVSIWRGATELAQLADQGIVIGELAALTGRPRAATVVAIDPTDFVVMEFQPRLVYKKKPEIIDKIDAAVSARYHIAANKAKMYVEATSLVRRRLLQQAIAAREVDPKKSIGLIDATITNKRARQTMEEALELHGHIDDPRTLRKVADEYNVGDKYTSSIEHYIWLDESLYLRFREIEDRMNLTTQADPISCLKERALVTCEMLDLLGEYESLPGVTRELDMLKIEKIIPLAVKENALKTVAHRAFAEKKPASDRRMVNFMERKVVEEIRKQVAAAGRDIPLLIRAAEELDVAREYEEELRKAMSISESSSTYLELPAVEL